MKPVCATILWSGRTLRVVTCHDRRRTSNVMTSVNPALSSAGTHCWIWLVVGRYVHRIPPVRRAPATSGNTAQGSGTSSTTRSNVSPAARTSRTSPRRSEEHTSELQSRENLVCRLLLEKKKKKMLCTFKCHTPQPKL